MGTVRHVVIPVAVEERNDTLPLAIASIRKHTDYNIVTIGHDHGLCEHIDTVQSPRRLDRWANTDLAMRVACEHFDTFIWSNDDIYWTRPAKPVRWALGDLADVPHSNAYSRRKHATRAWLTAHGLPTWDYEAHVPMLIEAAPMLEALEIAEQHRLDKRTIYGNMTGQPDVIADDVKIRDTDANLDAPWLSSNGTHHWDAILATVGA